MQPFKQKYWFGVIFFLWLSLLIISSSVRATASAPNSSTLSIIDSFMRSEMQALRVPGLALGVVQGDRTTYLRGYGIADPSHRQVTPQTPFFINSLTKAVTAIAVMQLVEAGKLDLDVSVQQYLPWFRTDDPQASAQITIRNLLYQTSGFSVTRGLETFFDGDFSDDALERNVRRLQDTTLANPVGETFEYSNINYDILGLLVQTVSGQSYENYVKERILVPLDMKQSFFSPELAPELAQGYIPFFGLTIPYNSPRSRSVRPAGGIISTVEDMTHLLIAYLNDGRYRNTAILSPQRVAELYRPGVETPGDDGEAYAMGWYVTSSAASSEQSNSNALQAIYHPGGSAGFYSYMRLIPERDLGIVLLMNTQDVLLYSRNNQIGERLEQLLLGQVPSSPRTPLTWLIRPILLAIALFQVIRVLRSVRRLRSWRSRVDRTLSKKIVRYSLFALAIDAVVFFVLFVVPSLQIEIPWMFLIHAVPDLSILLFLIALLTLGWSIVRTMLFWKISH